MKEKCPWCNGDANGPRKERNDCMGVLCNHECHQIWEKSQPFSFPWPIDKPVEELVVIHDGNCLQFIDCGDDKTPEDLFIHYLLTRLKLAEGERDSVEKERYELQKMVLALSGF